MAHKIAAGLSPRMPSGIRPCPTLSTRARRGAMLAMKTALPDTTEIRAVVVPTELAERPKPRARLYKHGYHGDEHITSGTSWRAFSRTAQPNRDTLTNLLAAELARHRQVYRRHRRMRAYPRNGAIKPHARAQSTVEHQTAARLTRSVRFQTIHASP